VVHLSAATHQLYEASERRSDSPSGICGYGRAQAVTTVKRIAGRRPLPPMTLVARPAWNSNPTQRLPRACGPCQRGRRSPRRSSPCGRVDAYEVLLDLALQARSWLVPGFIEVLDRLIGRASDPGLSCLLEAGSRAGGVDVERDLPLEDDGAVFRRRDFQLVLADAKVVGWHDAPFLEVVRLVESE
jgi:hypothetical protein